jgi:hypothetical protein
MCHVPFPGAVKTLAIYRFGDFLFAIRYSLFWGARRLVRQTKEKMATLTGIEPVPPP